MCGRIALYTTPGRLARIFDAALAPDVDPDEVHGYNIPPTRSVLGIAARPARPGPSGPPTRVLAHFRWGLVPSWARDPSIGGRLFNARGETVASKPSFRAAFAGRRLAVPVDGFYEWQGGVRGERRPHFFTRADGQPMVLAGLWERWHGPGDGPGDTSGGSPGGPVPVLRTCTVITTGAGPDMDGIHDRMPVVLDPDALDEWLDPSNPDRDGLDAMLRPPPQGTLVHRPVDARVGNVRNDDATLIETVPVVPGAAGDRDDGVAAPAG